ncbi:TGACG motif-binding factor 6 [Actinidia rufa]|uniref:TGACG motif-binding factor 6 n=1 Tax=Actinidia rufa TaxID=165716 RepID=A0A7J0DWP9_9ERIC|nr:TGACG motif-binding factor 6 [Actinidia rufa]
MRSPDSLDVDYSRILSLASFNTNLSAAIVGPQTLQLQNGQQPNLVSIPGSHRENGGESNMEDGSPLTDSSTDGDTDEKNQMVIYLKYVISKCLVYKGLLVEGKHKCSLTWTLLNVSSISVGYSTLGFEMARSNAIVASDSSDRSKEKQLDQKTLRRLAQNREAARKSRLRKKAYVQQLESSRLKLAQLEQELQRARQQGIFISSSGDQSQATGGNAEANKTGEEECGEPRGRDKGVYTERKRVCFYAVMVRDDGDTLGRRCCSLGIMGSSMMRDGNHEDTQGVGEGNTTLSGKLGHIGALAFDVEYTRWLEEHNRQINELRTAVNSHASDTELRTMVESAITHFDDVFRLKGNAAKVDVFHILSGMWKTPAERCFLWIGGFRSSELLKLLMNQLEPLTEQQLVGIYSLQQSSQQAEDALSQGMEALQQSLAETLANGSPGPSGPSGNVANYMGQMAMAMGS